MEVIFKLYALFVNFTRGFNKSDTYVIGTYAATWYVCVMCTKSLNTVTPLNLTVRIYLVLLSLAAAPDAGNHKQNY